MAHKNRTSSWLGIRSLPWFVAIAVLLAVPSLGTLLPRCDGGYAPAMQALNECSLAQAQLGTPIRQDVVGVACGSSESTSGGSGAAQWSFQVGGPKGSGEFRYQAQAIDGKWLILEAQLVMDDSIISVVPCQATPAEARHPGSTRVALNRAFEFTGQVTQNENYSGLDRDARCTLSITPNPSLSRGSRYNCHIKIRCGQQVIYGWYGMGYNQCLVDQGQVVSAHDPRDTATEGDPILELDLPAHRAVVRDEKPKAFRVVISID